MTLSAIRPCSTQSAVGFDDWTLDYYLAEILCNLRTIAAGDVFSLPECLSIDYFPSPSVLLLHVC